MGTFGDEPFDMAVSDDKIYVGIDDDNYLSLFCLSSDGVLDTTFSGDGKFQIDPELYDERTRAVEAQSDDKIVVSGYSNSDDGGTQWNPDDDTPSKIIAMRVNADGTLDTSFNTTGRITITPSGYSVASGNTQQMKIRGDGKILIAGSGYSTGGTRSDAFLVRLNADGTVDTDFGGDGDGQILLDLSGKDDYVEDMAIDTNGRILLAGTADGKPYLARLYENGTLDSSFGTGGIIYTSGECYHMLVKSDGKIMLADYRTIGTSNESGIVVTRLNSDGSTDTAFGDSGSVFFIGGYGCYGLRMVETDNAIVLGGSCNTDDSSYSYSATPVLFRIQ